MTRKVIGTNWDRENRNNINANFETLFNDVGEGSNLAKRNEQRIIKNEMDIAELFKGTGQALEAAEQARTQANNAQQRANEAKTQADYAKAQGDYAKTVADNIIQAPHIFHNEDENKAYQYAFKVKNGHLVLTYQEVK